MQKNASLLAIVAVDTAENEPSKVCDAEWSIPGDRRCAAAGPDGAAGLAHRRPDARRADPRRRHPPHPLEGQKRREAP